MSNKLLCINSDEIGKALTVGKIYEKLTRTDNGTSELISAIDDYGHEGRFYPRRFISIEDYDNIASVLFG